MGMTKPNNLVCDSCSVVRNKLRCSLCKHKTTEWVLENMPIVIAEVDCYKPQESEVEDGNDD